MRFKNVILVLFLFMSIAANSGCVKNAAVLPAQNNDQPKEDQQEQIGYEITDSAELEALWQEYLYDSIPTVGNARTFDSAADIDPYYVAAFCWFKYIDEHGTDGLAMESENSMQLLFPLDTALLYAERFFNLTALDLTKIDEGSYDPNRRAFLFGMSRQSPLPSYRGINPWGYHLDKVTQNGDDTVTAVLSHDSYLAEGKTDSTQTYTFGQREDKSLYFISGKRVYINNHLVSITGGHTRFNGITGFDGDWSALSMLGETENGVILAYAPYQPDTNGSILLIDPETMTVTKRMDINGHFSITDVSMTGSHILIRFEDRYITADKALSKQEEKPLPDRIAEKAGREPQYNQNGFPDVFYGGYDVSDDGTTFVYADEEGVKLLDTVKQAEKLMTETIPVSGSELLINYYHMSPRFVSDGQKVISTLIGYEGAHGYVLCNLKTGEAKTYLNLSEASTTAMIRYDTGILEVNAYDPGPDGTEGDYRTAYLDFKTGEVQKIDLADRGQTGDIRMPDYSFVGGSYAAFLTYQYDTSNNANNLFSINRLDLSSLETTPGAVTVKAAEPHMLGVLKDGRTLFWYSLNPSEEGICITD